MNSPSQVWSPSVIKSGGGTRWFRNSLVNPFVRLILRSRFHALLSQSLLLITIRGRQSERAYTFPVQYVRTGATVTLVVGEPEQKQWWRNLRGGAPVQLLLGGQTLAGEAEVWMGEQEPARVICALVPYLERFPALARLHHLYPTASGGFHLDELQAVAKTLVMVHVQLMGDGQLTENA
jgi:hypothetical protein